MKAQIFVVRESLRHINRRVGVLRTSPYGAGITLSQGSALVDIDRAGQLRASELVTSLNLDKSSISRLVQGLIVRKLVKCRAGRDLSLSSGLKKNSEVVSM